ncbi:MAG TPA: LysR family transcriptional regulator [Stellaceae bacterium]|jgi:DNA-binding transcriptional LysR family regulator|nr:LysR family transcriptional regulator [Stellaceae bacterium]
MDIRAVDLNLLKAFDALMAERAVTRAAGRIGLSQPAMSHALSRLRGLFADDLFVRNASGMEPTARAREIAPLIAAAIEQIEAALNLAAGFDPARSTATFTAGMAEYAEVALVGRLARAFAQEAPGATLRLLPAAGGAIAEDLDRGAIDVAVAHVMNLPPHVQHAVLLRDPFVVVMRQGHPATARPWSLEAYAAQDHLLVSPRGATSGALDRILVDFGLKRRIALLVATYLAVPAALVGSDLVATVPSRTAEQIARSGEIKVLPLPIDFAMTVSLAWHRRATSDPAQTWFRALLVRAASEDD